MAKITGATPPEQQSKAALLRTVKSSDIDEVALSDCVGLFVEVDRAIARRQNTSSAILERLSHHSDKIVRQAVASHHNILSEDLMRLGKQFPDAFLSNPALDLILIENPGLLLNFDESLLVQIAKRDACPEVFLKWAIRQGSEQVLMAIAMNPSTPVELLQQLLVSEFKTVQEAVRFHKKLLDGMEVSDIQAHFKQAVIERLGALTLSEANQMWKRKEISLVHFCYLSVGARLSIASDKDLCSMAINPTTSAWVLADIAKENDEYVRLNLAEDPNAPSAFLRLLAKDKDYRIRSRVAENSNAPEALLKQLAKDKVSFVRGSVASNPNTPEDLLTLLSEDKDNGVRESVAENSNASENLLMLLSEDNNNWVRYNVTENPNTPIELLKLLAEDKVEDVRASVACNPNAPFELLSLLANDKSDMVRESVSHNPNTPIESLMILAEDFSDTNLDVLWNISSNPNIPRELAQKLLPVLSADLERNKDIDFCIDSYLNAPIELQRQLLSTLTGYEAYKVPLDFAKNPNTSEALLTYLSKDYPSGVARNPNAPETLLTLLSEHKDSEVRAAVAANSNCSLSILQVLSIDEDTYVRNNVVSNPKTTKAMLEGFVKDKRPTVRSSIALNPKCPDELLIQLCHDKNLSIDAKVSVIEKLNFPEDILALPHFNSILQTKAMPEKVLIRLGQHEDSEVRSAALSNPLHPSWIKSLIEAPKTNDLFIKWASEAQQSAQSALESDNVFFFAGKDANKAAGSKSELVRILAMSYGASVEPTRLAKSQKHNDWLVRMSIASNIGTPINALNKLTQDSHALVAKQAEMTIAKLSGKPDIELLDEEVRQSSFYELSKDIAVALKSKHHQTVAIDDPVWGRCINPAVLWDPSRINEVTDAWADAEWKLFGEWIHPLAPEALAPYLTSEATETFMLNHLKRKKKSIEYLASHIHYSEAAFKLLSKDKNVDVRERIASNPNTPEALLTLLSKDKNVVVRKGVAENRNTPPNILAQFANDKKVDVLKGVARNPNTLPDVLAKLAKGKSQLVREYVAGNSNTPKALLALLSKTRTVSVRAYVAGNPNTLPDVLAQLASDEYYQVRYNVAYNPNTPEALLTLLSGDKESSVRRLVALNPNTPEALLMLLSEDEYSDVRSGVAGNQNIPEALLTLLSGDKESSVRRLVALNPNTPEALLTLLSGDNTHLVRYYAVKNLDASKDTFEISSTNKYACLQSLSLSEYKEHIRIALSPEITLPTDITTLDIRRGIESLGLLREEINRKELTQMRISKNRLQRVAVCFHHQVTENLLAILSEDKDLAVAEIAKEMLATFDKNATYAL